MTLVRPGNQDSPAATVRRSIGWAGMLGLVVFGVVLALLLAEAYLRSPFVPVQYRWEMIEAWAPERWWLEEVDPALWHRLPPGLDVVIHEPGGIAFRVRTTSLGFSGIGFREDSAVRPAWAVALGDSFTMGWGVDLDKTWVKQLQKRCAKPVLNLGIAGTCPTVYTRVLERYGLSFEPQLVFYQIYVGNDLEDEWIFLQWRRHPWLARMHLFGKRHSYFYVFLQPRLREFLFGRGQAAAAGPAKPQEENRILDQGWALAKPAILEAEKLARQHGARLVILLVPAPEAVQVGTPGAEAAATEREMRKRAKFLELCQAEKLDCVDLLPALRQASRSGRAMYLGDRHFTPEANNLVAEVLNHWLKEHRQIEEAP